MKNLNKSDDFTHGKHVLTLNSGFQHEAGFKNAFMSSETLAQQKYDTLFRANISNKEKLQQFLEIAKKFQEKIRDRMNIWPKEPDRFVLHGGGTIFEYCFLNWLLGKKEVNITMHEPRLHTFQYEGEEKLGVERGVWAFNELDDIKKEIVDVYQYMFKVKIRFVLERENFIAEKAIEAKGREKQYEKFDSHILSTHALAIETLDGIEYLPMDGSLDQFETLLKAHGVKEFSVIKLIPIVNDYVDMMYEQVSSHGKESFILGHCDLIRLNLFKYLESKFNEEKARKIVKEIFAKKIMRNKYKELFKLVKEKGMSVEINLAGEVKGVGAYGLYFIKMLKELNVPVVYSSDSHSVEEEWNASEEVKNF